MAIKKLKSKALSSGRPPFSKTTASKAVGSSRATRSTIRNHHNLLKAHSKAMSKGDVATAKSISAEIANSGGLEAYQRASQTGQMSDRGGDTSKMLVSWLQESDSLKSSKRGALRVLEVGCLSPNNAISKCAELIRIDLRSTHPEILEQDFMLRPLPAGDEEKFEVVSLSLVLNFVPDAVGRGDMLFRTTQFLAFQDKMRPNEVIGAKNGQSLLPLLFLTLPLPCVINSRYLSERHLEDILFHMGYRLFKSKSTAKMFYSLWILEREVQKPKPMPKKEVNPGKGRNNFCIVVK